jgi:fructosamine-3-kinase
MKNLSKIREGEKTTVVNFKNTPKISPHEVDFRDNERKLFLVPLIETFVKEEVLFSGHVVSVEFLHEGVSSLVSIISYDNKKLVLKIPVSNKDIIGESLFLEKWRSAGVSTPHIIREGKIGDFSYLLMEFIDSKTISDAYENYQTRIQEKIFYKMGIILHQMHIPKTKGFGFLVKNERGEIAAAYSDFKSWINSPRVQEIINYCKEYNLIREEHGSIDRAVKILEEYVGDFEESSFCHFDFGIDNIFATDPFTVFDPYPMLGNAIIDVGKSIVYASSKTDSLEPGEQFKQGYFFEGNPVDMQVVQASVIFNAGLKFRYWDEKKTDKRVGAIQNYLIKTKHFLD